MKKILMVDDDKSFLKVYSEILRGKGYDTSVSEGGRQALELLAADYYDIVLSDVAMPEMNGIELGTALRMRDDTGILLYLTTSPDFALDSYRVDAFDYL